MKPKVCRFFYYKRWSVLLLAYANFIPSIFNGNQWRNGRHVERNNNIFGTLVIRSILLVIIKLR